MSFCRNNDPDASIRITVHPVLAYFLIWKDMYLQDDLSLTLVNNLYHVDRLLIIYCYT